MDAQFNFTQNLFKTVAACAVAYFLIFNSPVDFSKIRLSYGDEPHTSRPNKSTLASFGEIEVVEMTPEEQNRQPDFKGYIERYSGAATEESTRSGIPASIILGQGLLESDAGQSKLARATNNHFGIKCFSKRCPKGHCANFTDDSHKDFFVKYKSAWGSFRAHSEFLKQGRYRSCFECNTAECWARKLSECGYATDKRYAEKLIRIIKLYNLTQFDK